MVAIALVLILSLKLLYTVIAVNLEVDTQWLLWDIGMQIESILAFLVIFYFVSYRQYKLKLIALILLSSNIMLAIDYLIQVILPENIIVLAIRSIVFFLYFLFVFGIGANIFFQVLKLKKKDDYSDKYDYICYKTPKNLTGILSSSVTLPYGHCSLIVRGCEYRYTSGILTNRDHIYKPKYHYRRIKSINKSDIDSMLGSRWTLTKNCFISFKQFIVE